jgi:uncharacterized membrane protein (TIGR02234 family)
MAERSHRRSFGPVVLLGLASATLVAVAGNRTWVEADTGSARDVSSLALSVDAGKMPAATAMALVLLASWGVVLVTRGRVRRAVAALGILAALGSAASVVLGWTSVVDALRSDLASVGVTTVEISHTGWFWAAAVGAVLALLASVLAVAWSPDWPEMGSRYDAPGAAPPPTPDPEDQSSLELWKAMDEGRDPTSGPAE